MPPHFDPDSVEGLHLSRNGSAPLYLQLADGLAYAIATDRVGAGTFLPSLREAEALWGVNLHTVRRAYQELGDRGLARTDVRRGTVVLGTESESRNSASDAPPIREFIDRFLDEGSRRFGVGRDSLARMASTRAASRPPRITVVECSATLSRMLGDQVSAAWAVEAIPIVLGDPLPPRTTVSTYFHFNELRAAVVEDTDLAFVHIRPSSTFYERIGAARAARAGIRCVLLETDDVLGHNVAADIRRHFAGGLDPEVRVLKRDCTAEDLRNAADENDLTIVSPLLWDRRAPGTPQRRDVVPLTYEIEPRDLLRLGAERLWSMRT